MAFGPPTRRLIVLDFDETLTSIDTLLALRDLLPTHGRPKPPNPTKDGCLNYANRIFQELRSLGYTTAELRQYVAAIPPVPSIVDLIKHLHESCDPKYDIIIISDANSIFIQDWLAQHNLTQCIKQIFTNDAFVVSNDGLRVQSCPHTNSNNNNSKCALSRPNLCKRSILERYLAKRLGIMGAPYERVLFIADGEHDYCPTLCMRSEDVLCVRKGKQLETKIRCYRNKCKVRPLLLLWSSGHELLELLETALDCVAIACI